MTVPRLVVLHDIVQGNGKTIRENNLERKHQVAIGTELRMSSPDPDEPGLDVFMPGIEGVVTCYVVMHARDCDGAPLYALSPYKAHKYNDKLPLWVWLESIKAERMRSENLLMSEVHRVSGGFGEEFVLACLQGATP